MIPGHNPAQKALYCKPTSQTQDIFDLVVIFYSELADPFMLNEWISPIAIVS
jgi:hypothetical protein